MQWPPIRWVWYCLENNILYNVHKVTTVSSRICAVQFDIGNTSVLLSCVYMPTGLNNSTNAEYNQILNELASVYLSVDPNYCIIGGDFNVDFSRKCVCLDYIQNFMKIYSFSCSINSEVSDNLHTFKRAMTIHPLLTTFCLIYVLVT